MMRLSGRIWLAVLGGLLAIAMIAMTLHAAMAHSGRTAGDSDAAAGLLRGERLVIYCGRAESLVGDLIEDFRRNTGIDVKVKYGRTGHLAALILEEGQRSPADVFFAQDPGGLGLLAARGRLQELPENLLGTVAYHHRDPMGRWIGVTGRLRTLAWSTERLSAHELPNSLLDLTHPRWHGRIGWAPANASFQALVTAMRHELGDQRAERWLREMIAGGVRTYPRNTPIVQAVADGEIDLGLVNHYYLHRFRNERGNAFPVANHVPEGTNGEGDLGGTMLLSGAAVLDTARNTAPAQRFIEFLLSEQSQQYFAAQTFEYPLAVGVNAPLDVPSLETWRTYETNLTDLADLEATIELLRRVGALR